MLGIGLILVFLVTTFYRSNQAADEWYWIFDLADSIANIFFLPIWCET